MVRDTETIHICRNFRKPSGQSFIVKLRQGSARDGSQGERPQSLKPCQELTLKLVATFPPPPPGSLITPDYWPEVIQVRQVKVRGGVKGHYGSP